ncbi:hypothetical protein IW146_009717 [Coemansia sp. RSA 922]|nr:hypothetical protein IW146_009717 [Coemansia sp. RSA 922]
MVDMVSAPRRRRGKVNYHMLRAKRGYAEQVCYYLIRDVCKLGWKVSLSPSEMNTLGCAGPRRRAPRLRPASVGVLTYNVQGIRGKKEELMLACHHAGASILCLQETLLHEGDWRLRLPGYDVLEEQADGQGRRGVALACRCKLGFVQSGGIPGYMIVAAAHSISPGKKWSVGSLYIPHTGCGGDRHIVLQQLKAYLRKEAWSEAANPILLGGDFNMRPQKLAQLLHKWGTGFRVLITSGSPKTWHGGRVTVDSD